MIVWWVWYCNCSPSTDTLMHGGAFLKAFKAMAVVAVVLFASSLVRADDTRINNNGGGSPGDPQCGLDVPTAESNGFFQYNCNATAATGTIRSFSFEVLDANTESVVDGMVTRGTGLTCVSNLTEIGWTGPSGPVHNPGGVDVCTFAAPPTENFLASFLASFNDQDCDLDDFVFGIPVNCGIHNNNNNEINGTPTSFSPFVGGAPVGFGVNGSLPSLLPEPSSMSLVLIGLAGLPLVRRKFAR